MTAVEIAEAVRLHRLWLRGEAGGARANLHGANLNGAYLPSPTAVLLASWGDLSDSLTASAMALDAACHPDPQAFTRWANRAGACPYSGVRVERAVSFQERRECWDPRWCLLTPRPYDVMVSIIREKCADSDWHDAKPDAEVPRG